MAQYAPLKLLKMAKSAVADKVYASSSKAISTDVFLHEADALRSDIGLLALKVEDVKKKQSEVLASAYNNADSKEKLEILKVDVRNHASKIRTQLHFLESCVATSCSSADVRIRESQHASLTKQFQDTMHEYQASQADYMERCKKRLQRQLDIAGMHMDNEQLDEMIESGNPAIFTQGIIAETQQAKHILSDVEDRHRDIQKLERSIIELHEVFVDISVLVEQQGEQVDRIADNVEKAVEHVTHARHELTTAVKEKKKFRKRTLILIVAVIVIVLVIALAVTVYVCTTTTSC